MRTKKQKSMQFHASKYYQTDNKKKIYNWIFKLFFIILAKVTWTQLK